MDQMAASPLIQYMQSKPFPGPGYAALLDSLAYAARADRDHGYMSMRTVAVDAFPGPLQTLGYRREGMVVDGDETLIREVDPKYDEAREQMRVDTRTALTRGTLHWEVVFWEGLLLHPAHLMADQIRHLLDMANQFEGSLVLRMVYGKHRLKARCFRRDRYELRVPEAWGLPPATQIISSPMDERSLLPSMELSVVEPDEDKFEKWQQLFCHSADGTLSHMTRLLAQMGSGE